jgi:NhaA family Na+:H+ antiporter
LLFGRSINPSARLFLLSLAIVDDIGTIAIMALFYSVAIDVGAVAIAVVLLVAMIALRVLGIRWHPAFVALGTGVWLATFSSGASATLAGVAVAFITPVKPLESRALLRLPHLVQRFGTDPSATLLRETRQYAHAAVSVGEWLEHVLHRWASYGILPLFALANAGLFLGGDALGDVLASPVAIGIVLGRVVGKPLGIVALVWLASRLRMARLPEGVRWSEMGAVAVSAGVGFTVALVVTDLALTSDLQAAAKFGLLAATVLSALASWIALRAATRSPRSMDAGA